jgi:hypothetical protein
MVFAGALVAQGCRSSAKPPTDRDIIGTWSYRSNEGFRECYRFLPNGVYRHVWFRAGARPSHGAGTWRVESSELRSVLLDDDGRWDERRAESLTVETDHLVLGDRKSKPVSYQRVAGALDDCRW